MTFSSFTSYDVYNIIPLSLRMFCFPVLLFPSLAFPVLSYSSCMSSVEFMFSVLSQCSPSKLWRSLHIPTRSTRTPLLVFKCLQHVSFSPGRPPQGLHMSLRHSRCLFGWKNALRRWRLVLHELWQPAAQGIQRQCSIATAVCCVQALE